ncbi:hypothetical protein JZO66_05415 [Enterococcus sp. DIV0242_7C1]|uniref:Lipoprotein n=1 Tax=Candidatus Enterococcus dunnyi TaxID=1834192 RepID=A0A200IZL0_9ENTE|nr:MULTISPECIES: hypothetical protein [unclassified Enterococcus]MBO0469972.1 hypothetical protein [Enterococcus sp. DIV0242_7C1]OUZ30413.1 hypothetical protein A5889_002701 [Enterococcus sp. 9D6_DIV0238]
MKKIVKVILWAGLVFLLVGCASNTAENIEVNDDKVPSVYSVIGEKKIVGTNSEVKNKVRMTTLTYKAGSISEKELQKYIEYLREKEGYVYTLDSKQTEEGTLIQLGKESKTKGNIVLVDFLYPAMDSESVKIMYRSGSGSLKMNE